MIIFPFLHFQVSGDYLGNVPRAGEGSYTEHEAVDSFSLYVTNFIKYQHSYNERKITKRQTKSSDIGWKKLFQKIIKHRNFFHVF